MPRIIFWGLMCMAMLAGCKKACSVNCMHGGTCNGNTCSCPDPYSGYNCDTMCTLGLEGYMCQTLSREKFIGTWSCTATDQSGNTKTYQITFTDNGYPVFMNMNNFNQNSGYPIVCTMTGKDVFSIDPNEQDSVATSMGVSGSGVLKNGQLVINVSENGGVSFFARATQQ